MRFDAVGLRLAALAVACGLGLVGRASLAGPRCLGLAGWALLLGPCCLGLAGRAGAGGQSLDSGESKGSDAFRGRRDRTARTSAYAIANQTADAAPRANAKGRMGSACHGSLCNVAVAAAVPSDDGARQGDCRSLCPNKSSTRWTSIGGIRGDDPANQGEASCSVSTRRVSPVSG